MIKSRIIIGLALLAIQLKFSVSNATLGLTAFILYLITGGHETLWLIWHTLPRDMRGAYRYGRLLLLMKYYEFYDVSVPQVFAKTAKRLGDSPAILFEDTVWTFRDLENYSNRVAHYLRERGFSPGDCIALFMENRPEYVGIWLGCAKAGVVPALINTHIMGKALIHSINAAKASAVIHGTELCQTLSEVKSSLPHLQYFESGSHSNTDGETADLISIPFDTELKDCSSGAAPSRSSAVSSNFRSKLLYVFTSGTTGLPKAAVIKQSRFYYYAAGTFYLNNMGNIKDPCFYNPLPLYHSAGGVVGIGIMMMFGVRIVIRRKFSVRNFWKDCIKFNCNGAQYIGEICRYLLSSPETPEDKTHKIQLLFGNGLRPGMWDQFTKRFGIHRIAEFYGSTEGNANLMNIDCKPGAVGFASRLFPFVYPVRLIRITEDGNVFRHPKTGLCILCKPGETGEFVGKIVNDHVMRSFDGYVDKAATEKKIVKNVLYKGDSWFRSGDLLNMDEFGWMYFIDRMGDTFRWRGENVSTNEVEAVLSNVLQQRDNIVYGVEVPGAEGRAGMAAIVGGEELDLGGFLDAIKNQLPSYATPLFVRLVKRLDITGTFKLKKNCLQKEGYNPNIIQDPLYFLDTVKGVYRKLDAMLYNDIMEMRCRI